MKMMLREFNDRLGFLVTPKDFVDTFDANTRPIVVWELENMGEEAKNPY